MIAKTAPPKALAQLAADSPSLTRLQALQYIGRKRIWQRHGRPSADRSSMAVSRLFIDHAVPHVAISACKRIEGGSAADASAGGRELADCTSRAALGDRGLAVVCA